MAESGAWLLVLSAVFLCNALKILLPSCSSIVSDVSAAPRSAWRPLVARGRARPEGRAPGCLGGGMRLYYLSAFETLVRCRAERIAARRQYGASCVSKNSGQAICNREE